MNRNLSNNLISWKNSRDRKPLILRGARQTGKTYVLKEFGKSHFANLAYFNFEENPNLKTIFHQDKNPERILRALSVAHGKNISLHDTLVFFDEIQEAPEALTTLKYFEEKMPTLPVVAAGSLLGLMLTPKSSFPVGKVNFYDLYPMSFMEFLDANGKITLREWLENEAPADKIIPEEFFNQLLELFRLYLFVGGMPASVRTFIETQDCARVRTVQNEILRSYTLDFTKHLSTSDALKIQQIWNSIPAQLSRENKKFKFSEISKNARSRDYLIALQWLRDAGLLLFCHQISKPNKPLTAYRNNEMFKTYFLDVGLLSATVGLSSNTLLTDDQLFTDYKGALVENFVAQELCTYFTGADKLFYWSSEGKAEVDFVIETETKIIPIEVKAGKSIHTPSLGQYEQKFKPLLSVIASPKNWSRIKSRVLLPIFALRRIGDY